MTLKRFEPKDLIYNTLVTKPHYSFVVHSGTTYLQRESSSLGHFSNNIKHMDSGEVSLHELNIDRPSDSMIYSFIEKSSTRLSFKSISANIYDDESQFAYGDIVTQSYPVTSSISRIYAPSGPEYSSSSGDRHANKKYISALRNPIENQGVFNYGVKYGNLGTEEVNLICIPGIFAGSGIDKGSIDMKYIVTGSIIGTAKDEKKDGRIFQTTGLGSGSIIGTVIYDQGIIILTSSHSLHASYADKYITSSASTAPSWINFGTGIRQTGQTLDHGDVTGSVYTVDFKSTNKVPTLTMYAYSRAGEENFSHNPSFLLPDSSEYSFTSSHYREVERDIKKINKSVYSDYEEPFENTTYISKIGIYDKDRNLIAIASLANPVKKEEAREYMFKLSIDF